MLVNSIGHLDQLTVSEVVENIYTNLNGLRIGQYHWHCTQTIINKLVNGMFLREGISIEVFLLL